MTEEDMMLFSSKMEKMTIEIQKKDALRKIKLRKAGRTNGILGELINYGRNKLDNKFNALLKKKYKKERYQ